MKKVLLILFVVLMALPLMGVDDASFVRGLVIKKKATVADAVIMVAMMQGHRSVEYASALKFLRTKGQVSGDLSGNKVLCNGFLAKLIMKVKGYSGGLIYSIFGGGRYAWRELVYRRIMRPEGSENHSVSGGELVAIVSRAAGEKPLKM